MHSHHHDHASGDQGLAELLDLGGELLHAYWSDVLDWLSAQARDPRRILDLGAGTGVGSVALARRFPSAEVIALDSSEEMLAHLAAKAAAAGSAGRVHPLLADLDAGWPAVDGIDLAWASLSLHHLADPDRVLAELRGAMRPGGLVAVAEFAEHLRLLPDDVGVGRPGLEERCLAALAERQAHELPELGADWSARLVSAGFSVVEERIFDIELDPPHAPATVRYAELWMGRMRARLAEELSPDDVEALDVLLAGDGSHSIAQRGDLRVRGSRTVTLARRP